MYAYLLCTQENIFFTCQKHLYAHENFFLHTHENFLADPASHTVTAGDTPNFPVTQKETVDEEKWWMQANFE